MTDVYKGPYADISAFVADANAINAATKTALNTGLTNIKALIKPPVEGVPMPHPDFAKITPDISDKLAAEIDGLTAAITAHA